MKFKEFLTIIKTPILILGSMIAIFSLISFFFGFQVTLVKDMSLFTMAIYDIFYHLDLTHDYTVASLFMSFVILICSFTFFLMSWGDREKLKISRTQQGVMKLFCGLMLLLSVDEILNLKYQIGQNIEYLTGLLKGTNLENLGYSWLIVYLPIALIGTIIFGVFFNKLIKSIRNARQRIIARRYLLSVIALVIAYYLIALYRAYLMWSGISIDFMLYIEEFSKLGMIFAVYGLVLSVSDNYNL